MVGQPHEKRQLRTHERREEYNIKMGHDDLREKVEDWIERFQNNIH
jgi:hypothetical protein